MDDGARGGEDAGGGPRRAAGRHLLRLHRPGDRFGRRGRRDRHGRVQSRRQRHTRVQPCARCACERGPARLPQERRDPRARRLRSHHRRPLRAAVGGAVRTHRGRRHRRPARMDEPAVDRAGALDRLGSERFDLLVVGGGIVGAGIAEAASAHGLKVALVDKGDFAGATSSASSKLIHGGLRYLRLGDVGLVREAHHERRALMRVVAPHLVRRLPFLLPLYADGPYRPWFVQSGVVVYSTLARAKLNGLVDVERAQRMVPELQTDRLRSCALYADAWTNDTRLTLANLRAAEDRGAVVVNYAEVVGVRPLEVLADGRTLAVDARRVVNASGPWIDRVRRLEDPKARASVRLSKGVHVVVDGGEAWHAAVTIPHDKVRVSFAVPWEGALLLGTTDTE
ncbi:MAG: FAD-dependent oxidoreductase, partial [Actinobacteria bacterium]